MRKVEARTISVLERAKFNVKLISVISLYIKECQHFYKMRQIELNIFEAFRSAL